MGEPAKLPALKAGVNCWRIERAARASVIVDAADYFEAARSAMLAAERRIMLIGWDFGRADPAQPRRSDEARRLHSLARQAAPRARDLPAALGHGAVKTLFRGTTIISLPDGWPTSGSTPSSTAPIRPAPRIIRRSS
jgi:hypothetical protein